MKNSKFKTGAFVRTVQYMSLTVFLVLNFSLIAFGQTTTTVADTLHAANGTTLTGTIVITPSGTFTAADGTIVMANSPVMAQVTNGSFSIALVPNAGSTPSGTYYRAQYHLPNYTATETWVVPNSSTPVNLAAVRSSPPPQPPMSLAVSQIPNPAGDVTGTYAATTVTGLHFGSTGIPLSTAAPTPNQCLAADSTAAHIIGTTCGAGGGTPGGANTAVQFNNSGMFGGDATNFAYNSTTHALTITGGITSGSGTGDIVLAAGTAPTAPANGNVALIGPSTNSTAYNLGLPSAAPANGDIATWTTSGSTTYLTDGGAPPTGGATMNQSGQGGYEPVTVNFDSSEASGTIVQAANNPFLFMYFRPFTTKITKVYLDLTTNATSSHCDFGEYGPLGSGATTASLTWHTGSIDCSQATGFITITLGTPVTESPGTYFWAQCTDTTTVQFREIYTQAAIGNARPANTWGKDTNAADNCTAGVLPSSITIANITNSTAENPAVAVTFP